MKQKSFSLDFNLKAVSSTEDVLVLEGYASKFLDANGEVIVDRDGESVLPSGLDLTQYLANPVILYQHSQRDPIGKALNVDIKPDGVYIKCEVYKELNPTVFAAAKLGVVSSFSMGFKVEEDIWDAQRNLWLLSKTVLWEVSLVALPANQFSQFRVVKSADGLMFAVVNKDDMGGMPMVGSGDGEGDGGHMCDGCSECMDRIEELESEVEELSARLDAIQLDLTYASAGVKDAPEGDITHKDAATDNNPEPAQAPEPTALTLEQKFDDILSSVNKDNFEVAYGYAEKLRSTLNTIVGEALQSNQS